jgi:hypothetical protein
VGGETGWSVPSTEDQLTRWAAAHVFVVGDQLRKFSTCPELYMLPELNKNILYFTLYLAFLILKDRSDILK